MTPDQPGQAGSGNAGNLTTASSQVDLDQLSAQLTVAYGAGNQGAISQILAQIENLAGAASGGAPPATKAGTALSEIRLTQEGESFLRYESGNPAFSRVTPAGGLQPGTFAAPASEGVQSQSLLNHLYNLPNPEIARGTYFKVNAPAGTPVIGPRPVVGGSGSEVVFPFGVGPGSAEPGIITPP